MPRRVVVLFGPPAAGKSTAARGSGLAVYDRDDERWSSAGEAGFRQELQRLRFDAEAAAIVIRTGATREARRRSLETVGATHAWIMLTMPEICRARAKARHRGNLRREYAAIANWWRSYDGGRDVPVWPGEWPDLDAVDELHVDAVLPPCPSCRKPHLPDLPCWKGRYAAETTARVLATLGTLCVHCHGANGPATTVDHRIPRSKGGTDDLGNTQPSCVRCNAAKGNRMNPVASPLPSGATLSARWQRHA